MLALRGFDDDDAPLTSGERKAVPWLIGGVVVSVIAFVALAAWFGGRRKF